MKSISKVYIQSLYWGEDELILSLVKGLVPQPEKALRISWVQGTDRLQMLIPKKLIEESDDLDLWAKCFESEDELKRFSDKALNWPGEKRWEIMGNIGESNVAAVEGRMA
ncbi:hypothetical protein LZ554_007335 [Drepanopeziza brunnea f. sp. 'monogermtubi']|nr:hypothetical protein LZ554_007335 [Drepanopeziza brunnea f. sp. 'monogermtubi']